MEAVVAILIMTSVLIIIYTNNPSDETYSDYVYNLQIRILDDVASSGELRNATLFFDEGGKATLTNAIAKMVPANFNFSISVCDLSSPNCLTSVESGDSDVFVEDRIISSNYEKYRPKILRLFIWEKK